MSPEGRLLDEITSEDIAQLAGVSPSAVSNWARRDPAFPKPLREDGRRTLYSRAQVMVWLRRHRPERLDEMRGFEAELWKLADRARGAGSLESVVELLAWSVAELRDPSGSHESTRALLKASAERCVDPNAATATLGDPEFADRLAALAWRLADGDDAQLDSLVEGWALRSPRDLAVGHLADSVIGLASIQPGQSILDTTAEVGVLLRRIGRTISDVSLTGIFTSARQASLAAALSAASRIDLSPVLGYGSLPDGGFDRVIRSLPIQRLGTSDHQLGGQPSDAPTGWSEIVEHCLRATAPDGLAVLAAHPKMLSGQAAARDRADLVESGRLVAVVDVAPPNSNSAMGALSLMVLRSGNKSLRAGVLMVDTAASQGSDLLPSWDQWSHGVADAGDSRAVYVPAVELAEHDFNLYPRRYVRAPIERPNAEELGRSFGTTFQEFRQRIADLTSPIGAISEGGARSDPQTWPTTTLGQLQADRVLHLAVGRIASRKDRRDGDAPVLTPAHLDDSRVSETRYIDLERASRDAIVRGGDLVIQLDQHPGRTWRLDNQYDGWMLGRGLARLRTDRNGAPSDLDWVAYWMTTSTFRDDMERRSLGATIPRVSARELDRIEIPLPPLAIQRSIVEHAAAIEDFRQSVKEIAVAGSELADKARQLLEMGAPLQQQNAHPIEPSHRTIDVPPRAEPRTAGAERSFPTFHLHRAGCDAIGVPAPSGFVVRKGSTARLDETPSLAESKKRLRRQLVEQGVLLRSGSGWTFGRDHLFNSPTEAASVIAGTNCNGRDVWTDDDGVKLGVWENRP